MPQSMVKDAEARSARIEGRLEDLVGTLGGLARVLENSKMPGVYGGDARRRLEDVKDSPETRKDPQYHHDDVSSI